MQSTYDEDNYALLYDISQAESQLKRLKDELNRRQKQLTHGPNQVSPIDKIPDEILLTIFTLAIPTIAIPTVHAHHFAPWTLPQVCKRWREVSLANGSIWARVDIFGPLVESPRDEPRYAGYYRGPPSYQGSTYESGPFQGTVTRRAERLLELQLERSRDAGLHITLHGLHNSATHPSLLRTLLPHIHRAVVLRAPLVVFKAVQTSPGIRLERLEHVDLVYPSRRIAQEFDMDVVPFDADHDDHWSSLLGAITQNDLAFQESVDHDTSHPSEPSETTFRHLIGPTPLKTFRATFLDDLRHGLPDTDLITTLSISNHRPLWYQLETLLSEDKLPNLSTLEVRLLDTGADDPMGDHFEDGSMQPGPHYFDDEGHIVFPQQGGAVLFPPGSGLIPGLNTQPNSDDESRPKIKITLPALSKLIMNLTTHPLLTRILAPNLKVLEYGTVDSDDVARLDSVYTRRVDSIYTRRVDILRQASLFDFLSESGCQIRELAFECASLDEIVRLVDSSLNAGFFDGVEVLDIQLRPRVDRLRRDSSQPDVVDAGGILKLLTTTSPEYSGSDSTPRPRLSLDHDSVDIRLVDSAASSSSSSSGGGTVFPKLQHLTLRNMIASVPDVIDMLESRRRPASGAARLASCTLVDMMSRHFTITDEQHRGKVVNAMKMSVLRAETRLHAETRLRAEDDVEMHLLNVGAAKVNNPRLTWGAGLRREMGQLERLKRLEEDGSWEGLRDCWSRSLERYPRLKGRF